MRLVLVETQEAGEGVAVGPAAVELASVASASAALALQMPLEAPKVCSAAVARGQARSQQIPELT